MALGRAPLIALLLLLPALLSAQEAAPGGGSEAPVVHAVLFFSPTCPHCHVVMSQDMPPLQERFGEGLQVAYVDVTRPAGQKLYIAAMERLDVPLEGWGVPAMLVGSRLLMGAVEIPGELPGLVEAGLRAGGVPWPDLPLLRETLEGGALDPDSASVGPAGPLDRFRTDPLANGTAVGVLLLMGVALVAAVSAVRRGHSTLPPTPGWVLPALGLAGASVAAYLSFVEVTGAEAVCGPLGDCNTVQQSSWARLFGVIPVGVLGLAGYLLMTTLWMMGSVGRRRPRAGVVVTVWLMALGGTVLSAWLTFLEPFVIGATCAWCLSSALIVTLMLLAATPDVVPILARRA